MIFYIIEIIKSISVNESFIWISKEEKNTKAIHVYEMNGFKKTVERQIIPTVKVR